MQARPTKPIVIFLYVWRGDSHYCVDLVRVSRTHGGWREAAADLLIVGQGKRNKHACNSTSHSIDPIPFSIFTLSIRTWEELLDRMCQIHGPRRLLRGRLKPRGILSLVVMLCVTKQFIGCYLNDFDDMRAQRHNSNFDEHG